MHIYILVYPLWVNIPPGGIPGLPQCNTVTNINSVTNSNNIVTIQCYSLVLLYNQTFRQERGLIMESNYRFFKLTEISSQSALIPFATAPIEFESGYTAYVVSGGAVYIRLNFDKNHNLEINILMTDLVEDLNNDQEDN